MTHPQPQDVMDRLRSGALDSLVDLVVDAWLDQPVRDLVDPTWISAQVAAGLRDLAARPDLESHLRDQVQAARDRARDPRWMPQGPLSEHLPAQVLQALEQASAWPWTPDRELLHRLLDHATLHALIQDVLQDTLGRFGRKLRALAPEPPRLPGLDAARKAPGLGRLVAIGSGVAAVGSAVAGALGSELEHQMDQRAREFAAGAISAVVTRVADTLSDPAQDRAMQAWRLHGLRVLLERSLPQWEAQTRQVPSEDVARLLASTLRAVSARSDLDQELQDAARKAVDLLGSATVASQLARTGMEERWRRALKDQARAMARTVLDSDGFGPWLEALLAPGDQGPRE